MYTIPCSCTTQDDEKVMIFFISFNKILPFDSEETC